MGRLPRSSASSISRWARTANRPAENVSLGSTSERRRSSPRCLRRSATAIDTAVFPTPVGPNRASTRMQSLLIPAVRVPILLLLAALAAFALGCQESGFDERKETARPLKVQHVKGESKVPGQAERPATLTLDTLDDTLALGLRPVVAVAPGTALAGRGRGGPAARCGRARDRGRLGFRAARLVRGNGPGRRGPPAGRHLPPRG